MSELKDLFVPYALALEIKELGYKQDGYIHLGYYNKPVAHKKYSLFFKTGSLPICFKSTPIVAPLWEQGFKWFKDKGYFVQIYPDDQQFVNNAKQWFYVITKGTRTVNEKRFNTFKEAQEGCFLQLIKMEKENDR